MGNEQNPYHDIRYNQILALLHEFNIRMTEMMTSSEDYSWVVDIVHKIFPQAYTVSLQFWRDKAGLVTKWVQWTDHRQIDTKPMNFTKGEGVAGHALTEKKIVNIADITADSRFIESEFPAPYRSLIVAPLIASDSILGTLSISALPVGGFNKQDEIYIDILARQIAILIHRSNLYAQEQEQRIFAEALRDIVLKTYQSSLDEMDWGDIFQHIHTVVPYTSANIILVDLIEYEQFIYTDGYLERGVNLYELLKQVRFMDFKSTQRMLKTKLPYRIPDTAISEDWQFQENYTHWIKSYIGVPLLVKDKIIGFLSLDSDQSNFFTALHEERLITFAATISQTIEHHALRKTEQQERHLANILGDAFATLANPLELDELLKQILWALQQLMEHSVSTIIFITDDGQNVYIAHRLGPDTLGLSEDIPQFETLPLSAIKTFQYMLKTHKVLIVPDTNQSEYWINDLYPDDKWIKSYAGAPIIVNHKVIGFFNIGSNQKNWFTQRHASILQSFANQASLAIQRAQLFEDEREQRVFAKRLSEIITRLTNTSNLDELFKHTLESINEVIVNDGATITLFKDKENVYFGGVVGWVLETNPQLKEHLMRWDELSTWRWMMQTREPLVIGDTSNSELWEDHFNVGWIQSYVGSPIVNENRDIIGFINLDSRQVNQFDEQDAERLKIFADHLATVIQKITLLEAEYKQREIADTLREIGLVVASLLKPDSVLLVILEHLKRVIEYTTASIWFLDEDGNWSEQIGYDYEGTRIQHHAEPSRQANLQDIFEQTESSLQVILGSMNDDNGDEATHHPILKSIAVAPLILREKVTGALVLWHIKPDFYSEYHRPILHILATQLAIAIDNAHLYAKQEAAHNEIRFYANTLEQLVQERTGALEKERFKLSTILQEIGEGVMVIERDSNNRPEVRFANNMFCQMLGVDFDEIQNRELKYIAENFVPSITYSQLLTQFGLAEIVEENSRITDLIIKRQDGTTFDAQVSFTLANLENEETWLGILLVRDVSKKRNLQRQRERFLANASHELRTPLTNLNTRFYLMRHQPEKLETHLDVVERTTKKMTTLVNDLLSLMRANQGNDSSTLLRYDIRKALQEVYDTQLAEAEMKNIHFTLEMPASSIQMLTQPKHLDQVFTNLISNAILYTPAGGEIKIICKLVDQDVQVSIVDTGIGIPAEFREAIFEPFTRVNVDELGTGLGLAIVKEIIEMYGGDIRVESEVGKGTSFHVQLPTLGHLTTPE